MSIRLISALLLMFASKIAYSGQVYLHGNIKNLTSTTNGLMIMLDTDVPDNCQGTSYGWMLIKEDERAMISTVLSLWVAGRKKGTVYTSGLENNLCIINQYDPSE